jgi:GDPmannose 4,6-dehydratase
MAFAPQTGNEVVAIDPRYFRPTEVEFLLADASRARENLGWEPKVTFEELVRIMVAADIKGLEEVQQCQDVIRQIMNNNTKP